MVGLRPQQAPKDKPPSDLVKMAITERERERAIQLTDRPCLLAIKIPPIHDMMQPMKYHVQGRH